MQKDRIRFVSAQPDELHFVWQTHVYLENFLALGIPPRHCVALFGTEPGRPPSPALQRLRERFRDTDIRVYEDTRDEAGRAYPASIQPHLIGKALDESPGWEGEPTFFQDCDIVFRRVPDFDRMLREHPRACLLSDTRDYIGFEHLEGQCRKIEAENPEVPPNELIQRMCEIVGIDVERVRKNEAGSGGAQYLLQGVGRPYWAKVYRDSIALWQFFHAYLGGLGLSKEPRDYLQVWTAGMWAYLWNLWLEGCETVIHPELEFLFSGASSSSPGTIIHMAGLRDAQKSSHFDKQDWWAASPIEVLERQPFVFDHLPEGSVAREYATWIHRAAGEKPRRLDRLEPARFWRLLAWKTDARRGVWDVEELAFRLPAGVSIVRDFDSGHAGPGYVRANAFRAGREFWGGREEAREGCVPCLYLGIELDRPAVPDKITLTQRDGPHGARLVVLQSSHDGADWRTAHVAPTDPALVGQTILYRCEAGHGAQGWRIFADATESGFAWDVRRLRFLRDAKAEQGRPFSSGHAIPEDPSQYGAANAFHDDVAYWGGRADAEGRYYLGLRETRGLPVNRVWVEQGELHFARRIEIQVLGATGHWEPLRVVDELGPGQNDILLFELATPVPWTSPKLTRPTPT